MTRPRDHQRSRVYAWEDAFVAPRDPTLIPYARAQGMVDAIWAELGLRYPPLVEPLPRQSRRKVADSTRLEIRLPEQVSPWILLHEIAHSLTSTNDGSSDGHGPRFMGIYLGLLERYLRMNIAASAASALKAGIIVDLGAKPVFIDP